MKINLTGFKTKVDAGKTQIELEHVFQPLEDYEELKVHCTYLIPSEKTSYIAYDEKGKANVNFSDLFKSKVKKIEGLTIEIDGKDIPIATADDLLALPANPELDNIVTSTVLHLLKGNTLTADEVKN